VVYRIGARRASGLGDAGEAIAAAWGDARQGCAMITEAAPRAGVEERLGRVGPERSENPRFEDTQIETWFERDRSHVELRNRFNDETIVEWWDDEVAEAVRDGFLNPQDWHRSAYEYAVHTGLIKPTEED